MAENYKILYEQMKKMVEKYQDDIVPGLRRDIDRLEAERQWISVEDRLPEPEQGVILCTREIETYGKHHEKKKIYRNIYMGYFDGNEWLTSYCHGCEYIFRMNEKYPNEMIEVTHWMPIPNPPKGE